jgi:hypothetical protein
MRKLTQKTKEKSEVKSKIEVVPMREQVVKAKDNWEKSYIDLARCIWDIHKDKLYDAWGYASMQEYCERELDFHYRRAMFMVDIYGTAQLFGISLDRLDKIGWSKARELTKVLTLDNVDAWLEEAENSTIIDLVKKIRDAKDSDPIDKSPVKERKEVGERDELEERTSSKSSTLVFKTEGFEYDMIMTALDDAKVALKTKNSTFALSTICMEWRASKMDEANPETMTINEWIAILNQKFGVKLVNTTESASMPGKVKGKLVEDERLADKYTDDQLDDLEDVLDSLD